MPAATAAGPRVMARANDQTVPVPVGTRPAPRPGWRADLWVAVERLPIYANSWDDYEAGWDDTAPVPLWDDATAAGGYVDATCDLQGVEIEAGAAEVDAQYDARHAIFTLLNQHGQWSQYDTFGRLIAYEPGSKVHIWAVTHDDNKPWWLFSGLVTAWRERADQTVEVEAFDAATILAESIGTWMPGTAGQTPELRIGAIVNLVGYTGPKRFDPGQVTLHAFETTNSPWEEIQATARSDGGLVGMDADGTLVYRNRGWTGGRLDQTVVRTFADNVCTGTVVVRDTELVTDDEVVANAVTLENVEGVTATAAVPAAVRRSHARSGELWRTVLEGQALATELVGRRADTYLRINGFTLLLHDPNAGAAGWHAGVDLRLGDLMRFVHDMAATDGTNRLDLQLVVQAIRHTITPSTWQVDVATTKAVGNNIIWRWGGVGARWDTSNAVWSN